MSIREGRQAAFTTLTRRLQSESKYDFLSHEGSPIRQIHDLIGPLNDLPTEYQDVILNETRGLSEKPF